jgi:hypothetical protein
MFAYRDKSGTYHRERNLGGMSMGVTVCPAAYNAHVFQKAFKRTNFEDIAFLPPIQKLCKQCFKFPEMIKFSILRAEKIEQRKQTKNKPLAI